jgi:hypothetical protein
MSLEKEKKSILHLQNRTKVLIDKHNTIHNGIDSIKEDLKVLSNQENGDDKIPREAKQFSFTDKSKSYEQVSHTSLDEIYEEAMSLYTDDIPAEDLLSNPSILEIDNRISGYLSDFNSRYGLDKWDYAIAGSCGLFAAMLDLLFVRAPANPTGTKWDSKVNGIFNEEVRKVFNKFLPPDKSKELSNKFSIGAPDASKSSDFIDKRPKRLSPFTHRLRALSHDPIIGFLFGVKDMLNGTCTIVEDGVIKSLPTNTKNISESIVSLLLRMFQHLLSDVNAPSEAGNRGMGLPAPFMGFLRMLNGVKFEESTFGRQMDWLYLKGYDFRQFITTSIPMSVMEILIRVFYCIKQVNEYDRDFFESLYDTLPIVMNPRFRVMLAIAYGVSSSVNAGKVYITNSLLNVNYASWMGLVWNGFHALRWTLFTKHYRFWSEVEFKEIERIERLCDNIRQLKDRVAYLPV